MKFCPFISRVEREKWNSLLLLDDNMKSSFESLIEDNDSDFAEDSIFQSQIFLLRWKTKVRERHLRPNFDEKQGTKSWISRGEKDLFKSWKLRGERESVLENLENREEKEKLFYKILKIERRKRSSIQKSCEPRGEREMFSVSVFKIVKIERRTRHENSFLQLERENQE